MVLNFLYLLLVFPHLEFIYHVFMFDGLIDDDVICVLFSYLYASELFRCREFSLSLSFPYSFFFFSVSSISLQSKSYKRTISHFVVVSFNLINSILHFNWRFYICSPCMQNNWKRKINCWYSWCKDNKSLLLVAYIVIGIMSLPRKLLGKDDRNRWRRWRMKT